MIHMVALLSIRAYVLFYVLYAFLGSWSRLFLVETNRRVCTIQIHRSHTHACARVNVSSSA